MLSYFFSKSKNKTGRGNWYSAFFLFAYAICFSFAYIGLTAGTGALILFGCVHDERMSGIVKVTVIATGFDRAEDLAEATFEEEPRPAVAPRAGRAPFLRGDDSGGFGPNASSRDDFDIPTVLRRQMD